MRGHPIVLNSLAGDSVYVTTKAIISEFLDEAEQSRLGPCNIFLDYARYKGEEVYASHEVFKELAEKLLSKDEHLYKMTDSLIQDGGPLIGTNTDFGNEMHNVAFIAGKLASINPPKNVIVVRSGRDNIDESLVRRYIKKYFQVDFRNLIILDVDSFVQIAKRDDEFRTLIGE